MTIDPVELERLSKAATQGVCPCCRAPCDVTIKPAYDFAWKDEFGNYQTTRHPAKRQYTYRTGQLVPAQPSGDVVERLVPKDYASIKAELAHIVPCYSEPTGCLLSDEENEQRCEDGCFILSVYKAGATAAITAYEAVSGVAKMREALKAVNDAQTPSSWEAAVDGLIEAARVALGEQP